MRFEKEGQSSPFNECVGVFRASSLVTFVLLKLVNATVGLRVTAEDEDSGLDLTQHGESAYND